MQIDSRSTLIHAIDSGFDPDYLFFWGHQPNKNGSISKSCLSQWFLVDFTVGEISYHSAEQFMMAEKARLFADDDALNNILQTTDPAKAKKYGRQVKNYDNAIWRKHRFEIVVKANLAKFSQQSPLKQFLLSTENKILIEASPVDNIWGIGLSADDEHANDPKKWAGENLLGFALMWVRALLT